ncbi:MAG: methyl-accepting chemotaxis protein [Ruminococcus sp.]|jgi:methyl-accepting chemotaxis protein|nr:methyl-accepting chemotaxis protein [Ruminococcus sp.]
MKLSYKLLIPITILSIISLLVVGIVSARMAEREVMNRFENEINSVLSTTATQFTSNDNTTVAVLDAFGKKNVALANSIADLVDAEVKGGLHTIDDFDYWQAIADDLGITEICIIGADGIIEGGNIAGYNGFDMNSGDQSRVFMAIVNDITLEIVQDPMPNSSTGKMMQYIGVNRIDEPGVIQVGLGAEIVDELNVLFSKQTIVAEYDFGETGFVTLVSADGKYAADADSQNIGKDVPEWVTKTTDNAGKLTTVEINGTAYFTKALTEKSGEFIVAAIGAEEITGGIDNITTTMFVVIAVTAVITIMLIIIMMQMFAVRPINVIIKRIHELTLGNFHEKDDHNFSGEFKDLNDSISQFTTTVTGYITEISDILGLMADGDYSVKVQHEYIGDFAPIRTGLVKITAEINNILSKIRSAAKAVSKSAEELSHGAGELAGYANAQSENAASITEGITFVNSDTKKSTESVDDALRFINETSTLMNKALELIKQLSESMVSIKTSSEDIMHVTNTVDSIAFQTNILALNASVEAARAGVNGKGFAVVAQEVRNLATKSADAVKETTSLIDTSVREINDGAAVVIKANDSFEESMKAFKEITEKITEINALTAGQNAAISDITPRLSSIVESIQLTAAEAEESAARSEELSALANELETLVEKFKLS